MSKGTLRHHYYFFPNILNFSIKITLLNKEESNVSGGMGKDQLGHCSKGGSILAVGRETGVGAQNAILRNDLYSFSWEPIDSLLCLLIKSIKEFS